MSAFFDFYLPHEKNLTNLAKAISRWKKRYEKQIVVDIVDVLKKKQFQYVEKEVELHSRDSAGNRL
ncbi:hypothetical protein AGMMS49532_10340 [Endomicrobiia bacterium]|nr:hypothetical protein AGMMS49532_10340 [Endomicrobiia bacterium]